MRYFVSFARFLGWIFLFGLSSTGIIGGGLYLYLTPGLPDAEQLKETQLQEPLRIFSEDGLLIAEFGEKRRNPVNINNVPERFKQAFIAAEDNRFYSHQGVDIKGLTRAAVQLITTGHIKSGGSTITMQVAKNFFLSREKTFTRKFNEILLSIQIEQELSKSEILELYFNKIYLGNRAYGIDAAAKVYYGKTIDQLTLAQMAMIAGLPKAPSSYNPIANPSRARIRRDWILLRMRELDFISNEDYQTAAQAPVTASYHGTLPELEAPYLAEMARKEMIKNYGLSAYEQGLEVYLTVNSKDQKAANQALRAGLEAYDKRHGFRGAIGQIEPSTLDDTQLTSTLVSQKNKSPHFLAAAVTEIDDSNRHARLLSESGESLILNWEGMAWARKFIATNQKGPIPEKPSDILSVGDIIYISNPKDTKNIALEQIPTAQSALISLRPSDGAVKALVGGYNFYQSKYNRVIQSKRQPGSNFKPFIYLAALENGSTAATLINDAPIVFDDNNLESTWRPENSSGRFYGPTRLRQALYQSRNLVSIRLLKSTGINRTLNYIENFGFDKNEFPKDLSLALGSAGVSPWDLARGYAIIANGGYKVSPYFIKTVKDANSNIIFEASPEIGCYNCQSTTRAATSPPLTNSEHADFPQIETEESKLQLPRVAEKTVDERAAFIMHSILKDVIQKGTGRKAKELKRSDIAGKTGTTNDQKDAWFSGFNGDVTTTVWVGFDQPVSLGRREYGATAALPIWIDYMRSALGGTPQNAMPQPEGIITVKINPETGLRAGAGDKNAIFEIFRKEYAPESATISDAPARNNPYEEKPEASLPENIF